MDCDSYQQNVAGRMVVILCKHRIQSPLLQSAERTAFKASCDDRDLTNQWENRAAIATSNEIRAMTGSSLCASLQLFSMAQIQ